MTATTGKSSQFRDFKQSHLSFRHPIHSRNSTWHDKEYQDPDDDDDVWS